MSKTKAPAPDKKDVYSFHLTSFDLPDLQRVVGGWGTSKFCAPSAVQAARLLDEVSDVIVCSAIGDQDRMPRACAGVLVVLLGLAHSGGFSLSEALAEEHGDNLSAIWQSDSWGQAIRLPGGEVKDSLLSTEVKTQVMIGRMSPFFGLRLLMEAGATAKFAKDFLKSAAGLTEEDFAPDRTPAPPKTLTQRLRLSPPNLVTAAANLEVGL